MWQSGEGAVGGTARCHGHTPPQVRVGPVEKGSRVHPALTTLSRFSSYLKVNQAPRPCWSSETNQGELGHGENAHPPWGLGKTAAAG